MTITQLKDRLISTAQLSAIYTAKLLIEVLDENTNTVKFNILCETCATEVDTTFDLSTLTDDEAFKQGVKIFNEKYNSSFMEYWDNLP